MNYHQVSQSSRLVRKLWPLSTSLLALSLLLLPVARAADSGGGSITGMVTSSRTHNALKGATVTIPSINRTVITDDSGSFILQNLPPGPLEVVMSYSGFTEER